MSTTTADEAGGLPNAPSYRAASVGPLEQKHMPHANYRAVALENRITPTHRHVAIANVLGSTVAGVDAGGALQPGASARPRHQHQPRGVVLRRLDGGGDHGHRRRDLGLADGGHGARGHRAPGDLRARDLP